MDSYTFALVSIYRTRMADVNFSFDESETIIMSVEERLQANVSVSFSDFSFSNGLTSVLARC